MRISGCYLNNLPPFGEQQILFPPKNEAFSGAEIHFITGINGAGKTRFLSVLEAALGNDSDFSSRISTTPNLCVWAEHNKTAYRWTNQTKLFKDAVDPVGANADNINQEQDGETNLSNEILVSPPFGKGATLSDISDFFALSFRGSLRIHDSKIQAQAPVKLGNSEDHLSFDNRPRDEAQMISQAIANIVSMGSQEVMQEIPDGRYGNLLRRVNEVLKKFLQKKTAFFVDSTGEKISLKVLLENDRIELNHLPDGLRSIIAWLFATIAKLEITFPNEPDPLQKEFIMLLDEPETHLHPAWQRYVLRIAQELFPNAQFIVATHSPFIISSINEGWVHILKPANNDNGLIHFSDPVACSKGDTYMDAVEDVLGISELYDPETEKLLEEFRNLREEVVSNGFTKEDELKQLMQEIGSRSNSLENIMGRELYQLEKAKQLRASA